MTLRVLVPAVVFLSALVLFAFAASPFFSLSSTPLVHAQSAPVFPDADANEDYTRSVDENKGPYEIPNERDPGEDDRISIGDPVTATGDDVTYSLKNAGTSLFAIDYFSGQLLAGVPLDYEESPTHKVTVIATIATDSSDRTATQVVTINVNNVDEPGRVKLSWKSASSGVEFTAALDEPDVFSSPPTWQWSHSTDPNSGFEHINGATSETYTRPTTAVKEYLRATATYTDSHVSDRTASKTLEVELPSNLVGYTPAFNVNPSGGYSCDNGEGKDLCINVKRNATPGEDIYYPAGIYYKKTNVPDRYRTGRSSFSLGDTDDDNFFDINPENGDLLAKGIFAYEAQSHYDITITATDPDGEEASITVRVNRSGGARSLIVEGPQRITYPENGTWRIANYRGFVTGPEETHGFIIGVQPGGGDGDFFHIDDKGILTFRQPPDYEDPADDNKDNRYSFSIHAYDPNPPRRQRPAQTFYSVTVIVYNIDEDLEIRGPTSIEHPENNSGPVADLHR